MSVAISLCNKMHFDFCANMAGFCRASHIYGILCKYDRNYVSIKQDNIPILSSVTVPLISSAGYTLLSFSIVKCNNSNSMSFSWNKITNR